MALLSFRQSVTLCVAMQAGESKATKKSLKAEERHGQ